MHAECSSTGLHIRAVVIDNASGDLPTIGEAVAASDWTSWVTCVAAPTNGGFAYGNNAGADDCFFGKPHPLGAQG